MARRTRIDQTPGISNEAPNCGKDREKEIILDFYTTVSSRELADDLLDIYFAYGFLRIDDKIVRCFSRKYFLEMFESCDKDTEMLEWQMAELLSYAEGAGCTLNIAYLEALKEGAMPSMLAHRIDNQRDGGRVR